jgi:hypothetical protein
MRRAASLAIRAEHVGDKAGPVRPCIYEDVEAPLASRATLADLAHSVAIDVVIVRL